MEKYISVKELCEYCNNQVEHGITPNDFMRMNFIEIPTWISVEDDLPTDYDTYIVICNDGTYGMGWYHVKDKKWCIEGCDMSFNPNVTHWMYKPIPPKPYNC